VNITDAGYLVLLLGYSGLLIATGLWLSRGVRSTKDFFVAGRDLPAGLLFSTFLAANIGAGSTVGATGRGYEQGLSAVWWVGSAGLGSLVLAFWVGPKIYELARAHNLYTVGDFLELRYSREVRLFFASLLWFGSLFILAGQLIAIAWILNVTAGLPKELGCLMGGIVVAAYFATGGLKTTAWLNVIQLSVKMLGFLIVVPWALSKVGGWSALQSPGTAAGYLSPVGIGAKGVLSYLLIFVPSFFISPGLLQKLYGARDAVAVRRGVGAQALGLLLYAPLPAILGMVAHAAYPGLANPELALPTVLKEMLPWWMGALLLAAVFSAELSASDAILFMLATSLSKDLYKAYLNPSASEENLLRVSRFTALAAGLLGVALGILLPSVVTALTIFYSLLTVVLMVPLLAGLYLKFPTARAAMAAMAAGAGVAIAAHFLTAGQGLGILNPVALGILAGAAVMGVMGAIYHAK
jgi:SSS family solute:Na+ symporter